MAAWIALAGTPGTLWNDSIGYYAADMGLYTGPWPMRPPAVIADGTATQFCIAIPNPADPTDLTIVGDGTYDCVPYYAERDHSNEISYGAVPSGPGSPTVDMVQPVGAHLYVTTNLNAVPSNTPESYVPSSYAAGGTAAFETEAGAWSDWQDAITPSGTSGMPSTLFRQITGTGTDSVPSFVDWVPVQQAALDNAIAALAFDGSHSNNLIASFEGTKAASAGGPDVTDASVYLGQSFRGFNAVVGDVYPLPHTSLVEWVDWTPDPDLTGPGSGYQYETPGEVNDFAWGSATWHHYSDLTDAGDYTTTAHVLQHSALPASGSGPVGGTEIASDVCHSDGTHVGFTVTPVYSGGDYVAYLSFLVDQITTDDRGSAFPPDASPPADFSWSVEMLPDNFGYTWSTSRWRYWMPGAIVPAGADTPSYLRMLQRNDGLGISRAPRLPRGIPNHPSSKQLAPAPRVGTTNTYH